MVTSIAQRMVRCGAGRGLIFEICIALAATWALQPVVDPQRRSLSLSLVCPAGRGR